MESEARQIVQSLYKNDQGKPYILTDSQCKIFDLIFARQYPRSHLMASTRFGKSATVALAVLTRVSTFPEKWAIVAPSEKKAKIIMGYVIGHAFDNEYTKTKLDTRGENVERLQRERSKNRLTFRHANGQLGEVFILSADSRNKEKAGESIIGFGAPNVVLDEASLIDDDIEAKIFRMLGDSMDNFYLNIGNPFHRNHFLKKFHDPAYFKMNIDYQIGLKEGRLSQSFIDEVRAKPYFSVLYENKFPQADAIDDKGWSHLITDLEFENALQDSAEMFGDLRLGLDVARGGGNYNVWTLRGSNFAMILARNHDPDLMSVVGTTIQHMRAFNLKPQQVYVDDTGVGGGVVDRLNEVLRPQGYSATELPPVPVNKVQLGGEPSDKQFMNTRAEVFWRLKEWINQGGKLRKSDDWSELLQIKYKPDSAGRLKIMSKDEMRRYGIESPDTADSLALTFLPGSTFHFESAIRTTHLDPYV